MTSEARELPLADRCRAQGKWFDEQGHFYYSAIWFALADLADDLKALRGEVEGLKPKPLKPRCRDACIAGRCGLEEGHKGEHRYSEL